jgi:hypothetical protein
MADNLTAIGNKASSEGRRLPFRRTHDADDLCIQIANARRLLRQANRKGIHVPDDVVSVVFTASEVEAAGQLDAALKTKFWNAYSVLQNITEPTDRARRHYRLVFYVTLILLLVTQCYFMVGVGTRDQILQLREQAFTLSGQLVAVQGNARIANSTAAEAAQQGEKVIAERIKQNGKDILAYHHLATWLMPFAGGASDEFIRQSLRLATLDLVLNFLGKYVLPALYGLLGACAFVLRQLSDEIGKLRFAHDRQVQYTLRLNIGLLGGLAVGWFVSPGEGASVVANLSPLALAFVAGYGSDLLFALLDRIVGAFVAKRDDAAGEMIEERVGGLERVTELRSTTRVAGGAPAAAVSRPHDGPDPGPATVAVLDGRTTERAAEPHRAEREPDGALGRRTVIPAH